MEMITQKYLNQLTYDIIGAAIEVHKALGPGLLESVYVKCLAYALRQDGYHVETERIVPIKFRDQYIDCNLRFDLLVNDAIIVEVKAAKAFQPIDEAQLLTYLKLMNKAKGLLLNFNCTNIFKEGQKTIVTSLFAALPSGYDDDEQSSLNHNNMFV